MDAAKRALVLLDAALVSVDDDGAEMDDPLRTGLRRGVQDVRGAGHVYPDELLHGTPLAHVGGGMNDQIGPVGRSAQSLAIGDVGLDEVGSGRPDALGRARVEVQSQDLGACGRQSAADRLSYEAAGPGDRGPAT